MANAKIGTRLVSNEELNLMATVFKDPLTTSQFVKFLKEVQLNYKRQYDQCVEVFLMNDEAATRAVALQTKGKMQCIEELITLINTVNK